MTDDKRFTTVELPKPNKWGIWYDGAYLSTYQVCMLLNEYVDVKKENEQLKSFKNDVHDLIDELIKKAEKDVEDLRKDAYEKGYAYNPYYYWGVAHGLEKLKEELKMND